MKNQACEEVSGTRNIQSKIQHLHDVAESLEKDLSEHEKALKDLLRPVEAEKGQEVNKMTDPVMPEVCFVAYTLDELANRFFRASDRLAKLTARVDG